MLNDKKAVELEITDIAYEGKGVGKIGGYVYFVPKTAVGDKIEVQIKRERKNFSDGLISNIVKPSIDRINPPCPYYENCGGCHYMHLPYSKQLEIKQNQLIKTLERIGKFKDPQVDNMTPSPHEFEYRNKSIFHLNENQIGFVSIGKEEIIDVENCLICNQNINSVLQKLRKFLGAKEERLSINNISIKTTNNPKTATIIFGVKTSIAEKLGGLKEVFDDLNLSISIYESETPNESSLIFSENYKKILGEGSSKETIKDFTFELSPQSFFQTNLEQAGKLVSILTEDFVEDFRDKKVLELYSGAGLFSIPLSKIAKDVVAVESSHTSSRDAQKNKELNKATNINFIYGKVREETKKLLNNKEKFDVSLLDPPRQGADRELLFNLSELDVEKIFYVSCSPPTLARDLNILCRLGYSLTKIIPIDMFPQTYHIESLSILERS